jgi:hypothetical protein
MSFYLFCGLVLFGIWAPGLPPFPRRLLRAASVYTTISFIARSVDLLWTDPVPAVNNAIADPLLLAPTYSDGIAAVSQLLWLGECVFVAAIYALTYPLRNRFTGASPTPPSSVSGFATIYAVSWLCRLADLAHIAGATGPGVLLLRLAYVGTALLLVLVVANDWRASRSGRQLVYVMLVGEIAWSAASASKTPLIASVLALYLDLYRPRWSLRYAVGGLTSVVVAFGVIEKLKHDYAGSTGLSVSTVIGNLLTRFDMLHALAVAKLDGPGSYMRWQSAASQLLTDLLPQQILGITRTNDGQNWATVMEQVSWTVSVATGPVAEGYAVAGVAGIIASEVLTGAAVVGIAAMLLARRSFLASLFGAYVLASAAPFEQGPLGLSQTCGAALQACFVVGLLTAVLPQFRPQEPGAAALSGYRNAAQHSSAT